MEKSTMNSQIVPSLATYQCVVCQITCTSLTDLHRHQSYRHTCEELSLSTIGLQCSSIRTFELPCGIVYDNSWLCDPNKQAEFYTYSANMLSDDNNNGSIVDYAVKNERVIGEECQAAGQDGEKMEEEEERYFEEESAAFVHLINEPLMRIKNFTGPENCISESKILDLTLKVSEEESVETKVESVPFLGMDQDHFLDCMEGLCKDIENWNKEFGKHGSSPEKCPVPQKIRKQTTSKKKVLRVKYRGKKAAEQESNQKIGMLEKREREKGDSVAEDSQAFDSQDSLSRFESEEKKITFFGATVKKLGPCQKKPLNLKKVAHNPTKQKRRGETKKPANQNIGKRARFQLSGDMRPEDFLACLIGQETKVNGSSAEKAEKSVNLSFGKEADTQSTGNLDSEDLLACLSGEETKINGSSAEKAKKPAYQNFGKEAGAQFTGNLDSEDFLARLIGEETTINGSSAEKAKKPANQNVGKEAGAQFTGNLDFEDFLVRLSGEETKINASSAENAKKLSVPRKKARIEKTEAEKPPKEETTQEAEKHADQDFGNGKYVEHSSTFSTDESLSCLESTEAKIDALPAVNAKKRIAPQKRAKNPKIIAGKLTKQGTTRETKNPANQDYGNGNSVKENSTSIHDVYSYTSNKSIEARITLPEFGAKEETTQETEKHPTQDFGNGKCVGHSSTFATDESLSCLESTEAKIDAMHVNNAKKLIVPKKRAKNSKIVADKRTKRETAHETKNPANQDYGNGNSVKENSTSNFDVYSYTSNESVDPKMTLPEFRAKNLSVSEKKLNNTNAADKNCVKRNSNFIPVVYTRTDCLSKEVKIDVLPGGTKKVRAVRKKKSTNSGRFPDKPVMQETAQDIAKPRNQDYEMENSVEQNSTSISDVYSFTDSENEEAKICNLLTEKLEKPKNAKTATNKSAIQETAQVPENPEKHDNENANSLQQNPPFVADYSLPACENEVPGGESTVTFIAYPPDLEDVSGLIYDPVARMCRWNSIDLPNSQFDSLDDAFNDITSLHENSQDFAGFERITLTSMIDNSTPSNSTLPTEINASASNDQSILQNNYLIRRSTRTKKVIDRFVP